MTIKTKEAPSGPEDALGVAGRRVWDAVVEPFELDAWESALLIEAARTADRLQALADASVGAPLTVRNARGDEVANPLLSEARQQSIVLSRLLASLRLPSGEESASRPQRRGAARGSYGIRGAV